MSTMTPTAGLLYKCKAISRILKTMASCNNQPFEFSAVVAKCFSQPTGKGQFSQADQHIGTAAPGNCGKRYTDSKNNIITPVLPLKTKFTPDVWLQKS